MSIPVLDGHLRGDGSLAVPSLAGVDSRGAAPGSDAMADAFSGAGPATVRGRARRTSAPLPSSLRAANPSGGLKGYPQGSLPSPSTKTGQWSRVPCVFGPATDDGPNSRPYIQ